MRLDRPLKVGLQAAATLVVVVSLYSGPVLLSVLLGLFDLAGSLDDGVFVDDDRGATREAVVWIPPGDPDGEDGVAEDGDDEPAAEEPPPTPPAPSPSPELASTTGSGPPVAGPEARPVKDVKRRRPRRRGAARQVVRAPPPELSPKEQRQRDRKVARAERRAERKQCVELVDQMVEVDTDSMWVGRELVNCYRTHPEQFIEMGGAWWYVVDGKKEGVRVHVSSRTRGDVARAAGFRSGDIVLSINGIPIRSDAWGSLAATQLLRGRGKVRILREGEKRTLEFKVVGDDKLEAKRLEMAALAGAE